MLNTRNLLMIMNIYVFVFKNKLDVCNKVQHLANGLSCIINDSTDVNHKRSDNRGYFNKVMSKVACIQPEIIFNLFKYIVVHTMANRVTL